MVVTHSEAHTLMDENTAYCEKHKVFQMLEGLMSRLVVERPDDPIAFLIDALQTERKPRVILSSHDKGVLLAQAELLGASEGLVVVDAEQVVSTIAASAVGDEAQGYLDRGEPLPDSLVARALTQRLHADDCQQKGWVLVNFPASVEQAQHLLSMGNLPTLYIRLDVPVADLDAPARAAADSHETAERHMAHLFSSLTFRVPAGGEPAEAANRVARLLSAQPPSRAPRPAPAVALVGPVGSGTAEQGKRLAAKFGVIFVSADELVETAILLRTAVGLKAKVYQETAAPVPDELVCALVLERLGKEDCRRHGWLLEGFPASAAQAAYLAEQGCSVRDLVVLELPDELALAEVTGRRIDPENGMAYHLSRLPPSMSPAVLARLAQHPRDTAEVVGRKLKAWHSAKPGLVAHFGTSAHTVDASVGKEELFERLCPFVLRKDERHLMH